MLLSVTSFFTCTHRHVFKERKHFTFKQASSFFYRENKFKLIKTVGSFTPIYFKYHVNERNQEAASLLWALIFQIFCSLSICYDISTFLFNVYITTKRKQQVSLKLNYFIACFSFFYEVWYYKVLQFLCRGT